MSAAKRTGKAATRPASRRRTRAVADAGAERNAVDELVSSASQEDVAGGDEPAAADGTVRLAARLGIAEVSGVHETLLRASELGASVRLDAGAVEVIDTSVLQMLVVHARETSAAGSGLVWVAASPAVRDGARALGLESHLRLPG